MKELQSEDLYAGFRNEENPTGFDAMEEEDGLGVDERAIWLENEQDSLLADVHDASLFYTDFPPLPDFPCMSSSSSSSSTPALVNAIAYSSSTSSACSSSSAASWAVLKSDAEEDVEKKNHYNYQHTQHDLLDAPPGALSSTASMEISQPPDYCLEGVECIDMMETFGYMDLLESNDFFDPSCIFQNENPPDDFQLEQRSRQEHALQEQEQEQHLNLLQNNDEEIQHDKEPEDMASVFLEWLRSNKETVSAEDLRSVRIKKSTIECAAKRLGGGKEAMKQLLKLVLEWVQTNHLQKRRFKETNTHFPNQFQDPFQNPNTNPSLNSNSITPESNTCFTQSPWIPQPPNYVTEQTPVAAAPAAYPSMVGYMGDPYTDRGHSPFQPPTEYHMLDSTQSWPTSQFSLASHYNTFPDNNLHPAAPPHPQPFSSYGNQYPYQYFHGQGERLVSLGSSATKEARKKRMARQRRFSTHHRHNHNHNNHQNQNQNQSQDQHARLGSDNCTTVAAAQANPGNWVYWPSPSSGAASSSPGILVEAVPGHPVDQTAMQAQNLQGRGSSDRRQVWKSEKNLRFLLQKVLKQSDVGNLGRIVLPKKEAETHLPELEARDGISIAMEDIGTSRVWNMRYRYWPNNKSRMYLLENTGDFVRANGLQEGDFIVIYSDAKCGKYMIRGVKVRQPGPKSESKRPGKTQRNPHASSTTPAGANGAACSPTTQKKVK